MDANLYALERLAEARLAEARAWRARQALAGPIETGDEGRAAGVPRSRWLRRLARWLAGASSAGSRRPATPRGAA